jgi:adenine phosphoribosyltransferase
MVNLKEFIRDIPDFPRPGVIFKDITPLLKNSQALKEATDRLVEHYQSQKVDLIVAIESRGFIWGGILAYKLNKGLVIVRKPKKLPYKTFSATFELEYGTDTLEIHQDAISQGQSVLIVDDLLATGGTVSATIKLVEQLGGKVVGIAFLIELEFLKGRERIKNYDVFSLIKYKIGGEGRLE